MATWDGNHWDDENDDTPEWEAYDDDETCVDCERLGSMMDTCNVCGMAMCPACFEMGAGVCRGPHPPKKR